MKQVVEETLVFFLEEWLSEKCQKMPPSLVGFAKVFGYSALVESVWEKKRARAKKLRQQLRKSLANVEDQKELVDECSLIPRLENPWREVVLASLLEVKRVWGDAISVEDIPEEIKHLRDVLEGLGVVVDVDDCVGRKD